MDDATIPEIPQVTFSPTGTQTVTRGRVVGLFPSGGGAATTAARRLKNEYIKRDYFIPDWSPPDQVFYVEGDTAYGSQTLENFLTEAERASSGNHGQQVTLALSRLAALGIDVASFRKDTFYSDTIHKAKNLKLGVPVREFFGIRTFEGSTGAGGTGAAASGTLAQVFPKPVLVDHLDIGDPLSFKRVDNARQTNTPGSTLTMRSAPGLSASATASIPHGNFVVPVLIAPPVERDGYTWQLVSFGGQQGYVASQFLS